MAQAGTSITFDLAIIALNLTKRLSITAINSYHGVLPSNLESGVTTEPFEIIFCGCEDGSILISELSDLVHAPDEAVRFHSESSSLLTMIDAKIISRNSLPVAWMGTLL